MNRKLVIAYCTLAICYISSDLFGQFGRGGRGGRESNMTELLLRSDIREEIELVDDQEEQLRQLGEEFQRGMRSMFAEIQDLPAEERGDRMRELFAKRQKELEEKVSDILLEHQIERLKQLNVQSRMRRDGASGTLTSASMKEALGLTDEQLEEIQEVAVEAEKELKKKIEEAQKQAQTKILGVLTAEQRAKWEKIVGSSFSFADDREALEQGRIRTRNGDQGQRGRANRGFGRDR